MPVATTLVGKSVFPEDHPLALGLGVYPRSRYATGPALQINRKADVVLAVGNSYRMPNGTDGRPIPSGVKLIHINADPADLNKTYRADVAMLADAKLAPARLILPRDHRSAGRGSSPRSCRDSAARNKWLGNGCGLHG
jgi:acetolactate synthase-1/2/3 large subunit